MKTNYPVIIFSYYYRTHDSHTLQCCRQPMGIPKDWNAGINGGVTALVTSIFGQKFAKKTSSGGQEEQVKT